MTLAKIKRATQRPDDTSIDDLAPGEWCWYHVDLSASGGPPDHKAFAFRTPNKHPRSFGMLNATWPDDGRWWSIAGEGETITVSPSIHSNRGIGIEHGEWHGFLTAGEWRIC